MSTALKLEELAKEMQIIICFIIGYIFGSFLPTVIIAKIRTGRDISSIGSGNPGMANVMSNIGKVEGVLVLVGDVLKVVAAILLSWWITWDLTLQTIIEWTGFATILGHDLPVWRRFRGGKGVAVTCAWLVFSMPLWGSISCIVGGIITLVSGYLPIGAVVIPVLAIAPAFITGGPVLGILVILSVLLMIQRHWTGIKRCLSGTERKRFRKKR